MSDERLEYLDKFTDEIALLIEGMRDYGMCFFEGYMPTVSARRIRPFVTRLSETPINANLEFSTWSNETPEDEWRRNYSTEQYLQFFERGKIITLTPQYEVARNGINLSLKLLIEAWRNKISVNIVCYRHPILAHPNRSYAVRTAISEFLEIKEQLGGSSLFVGPDSSDYPEDDETYPDHWVKVTV